ncbi:FAD-dependent oxidoreductase [candidate division KSB1 bacterium]|nr:FAD-dependent oxidoreductase [candidate division KSB1 bacterium]
MERRDFIKAVGVATLGAGMGSVTDDMQAGSENKSVSQEENEIVWTRKIPVRYTADVAVIGGGMAGVSAACAAARSGAKVILVERFAITGGMLTSGGVANFCGQMTGQGEVFDQIVADLKTWNAIGYGKETCFHYEILAIILQEQLLKRNVKMLLHTRFIDVRVDNDGRIEECIVCGKSGPEAVRAKQFIDCTGDGDVARYAGFETMKGGPSGYQLPMSMMYFVRHVKPGDARPHLPEGLFNPIRRKEDLPMTSIWPDGPESNAIKIKIPMYDSTDTQSLTKAEIAARRRMMEVLDYHQREEKKSWLLDHCSPIIGTREGCRILGDYVLTVNDLRAGRSFDDGVARGTYYLDGHKPDDDKRTYILPKDQLEVPPYQIPLRSLIAKDGTNLLMAGRCLSADQLALSSARVSTTCSMMGQAVGVTAALCAQKKCDPREVVPQDVKRIIIERGGELEV